MSKPSRVLDDIWECSSWVAEEHIQSLDGLVARMLEDARIHGVKYEDAIPYFADKLLGTIRKVAENRETEAQQIKRQQKQIRDYFKSK